MVKRALELDISFLADIQSGGQHLVVRRILSIRPSLPRLVADKAVALVGVGAAQFRASGPPGPARAGPSSLFGDDGRGGRAAGRCGPIGSGLLLGALHAVRGAPCARRRARACAHVRPASATRDTGSRQCRRSHSGRRRRRSVRRRRRRRDAGRRALAHDRQGAVRRCKNLVILKHKLDVRADAGVAT